MMNNRGIASLLKSVAAAYIVKDEKKYRFPIMAYERAADSIEHLTGEIKDFWEAGKLREIPGIGVSIAGHLEELFRTGKVKHFEEVTRDLPSAMFPLLAVAGFGPKKAYKLAKILKLTNPLSVINDLEKAAKAGKIALIPGFGEKSQQEILDGLDAYKKGKSEKMRCNLPDALVMVQSAINYLKQNSACLRIDPLGSLRRGVATIGDIDIAVSTKNPKEVINWFIKYPKKQKVIDSGLTGATLLLENGVQLDLRVQKPEAYGAMLQYFTGSKNHNIHLRELALKKGLSLSEYGIKSLNKIKNSKLKIYEFSTEKEFYEANGLDWIPPELREDTGEIEAALRQAQGKLNGLPRLVELKDIKGDLHVHSNYPIEPSHDLGTDSMEEMIEKAGNLDYEYLGFSEHSPSVSNHTPDNIYSILKGRKRAIDQLKLTSKIVRVINLLEVDILTNGNLSINDKSLALTDGIIASVHSSFNQPYEQMTARILSALANPLVRILGHPTGRLLGKREPIEADWEQIFAFCQKNNKALEINSWPERLDLPDVLVKKAIQMGVKLIISTDSHAVLHMDLMSYGVTVARRGWAERDDILNTLSYNDFYKWLKERG